MGFYAMPSVIESPPDAAPPATVRHCRQAQGRFTARSQERSDGEGGPPSKNRVGGFSAISRSRAGFSVPPALASTSETTVTLTVIVSGRSVWLSRDPAEERGGADLYWFVQNSPIGLFDKLGLFN